MTIYPTSALRTLALHAQNLHIANGSELEPSPDDIYQLVDRLGCVQIDTLHMVRRSQYLIPWSRMGVYRPQDFDVLTTSVDRRLFEGWQHAACIIPMKEYRYQLVHQRNRPEHPNSWYNNLLDESAQKQIIPEVLERIRREGALKVSNFESDGHRAGTWWNWRPAKVALELLYSIGQLMISERVNFQRVYDLTERVLPEWVDVSEPTIAERDRFWVERGARALGVGLARHAGDYSWMKVTRSRPVVTELLKEGVLISIKGCMANGQTADFVIHRDNLLFLEQASDGTLQAHRTTFLSPFDNLFWAARRDEMLWSFHQALECYLPAKKRVYGYFCLPILHNDRLVGRFDPKLERKTGVLRIKALYLEPGIKPNEDLIQGISIAMRDFMAFHDARDLVIESSQPASFGKKVIKSI
jgi:uncharacterized protein